MGILNDRQNESAAGAPIGSTTDIRKAAASDDVYSSGVTGDTQNRFVIDADGTHHWGSGAAATDTNLYRSGVSTLKTDDNLVVALDQFVAGGVSVGTLTTPPAGSVLIFGGLSVGSVAAPPTNGALIEGAIKINNGTVAGAADAGGNLLYGTGAPVNASGTNGDIYLRVDGAALSTIYQRRAGAWVGIV